MIAESHENYYSHCSEHYNLLHYIFGHKLYDLLAIIMRAQSKKRKPLNSKSKHTHRTFLKRKNKQNDTRKK